MSQGWWGGRGGGEGRDDVEGSRRKGYGEIGEENDAEKGEGEVIGCNRGGAGGK